MSSERERQIRIAAAVGYCGAAGPSIADRMAAAIEAVRPLIEADALRAAASAARSPLVTVAELRLRATEIERGGACDGEPSGHPMICGATFPGILGDHVHLCCEPAQRSDQTVGALEHRCSICDCTWVSTEQVAP